MDKNYWKEAYKEYWEISSKKEIFVKELIESKTGFKTLEVGLGAGSEDFLSGSASDYGLTKGDADLYVIVPDTYVEVTGPNISVKPEDTLWIRPDKVKKLFQQTKSRQRQVARHCSYCKNQTEWKYSHKSYHVKQNIL